MKFPRLTHRARIPLAVIAAIVGAATLFSLAYVYAGRDIRSTIPGHVWVPEKRMRAIADPSDSAPDWVAHSTVIGRRRGVAVSPSRTSLPVDEVLEAATSDLEGRQGKYFLLPEQYLK